jgi:hypothetical protein
MATDILLFFSQFVLDAIPPYAMIRSQAATNQRRYAMFAHYFKSASRKYVIISATMSPVGPQHNVASKREARQLSANLNAQCWNF